MNYGEDGIPTLNSFMCLEIYVIFLHTEKRQKLDPKSDEGIFLWYSINNMVYRMFNKNTKFIIEPINFFVNYDQTN